MGDSCLKCGSEDIQLITEELGKCISCGEYVDLGDGPILEKTRKHKPKPDDDEVE